ncbi:T-complex protein 11 family protein [Leishmania donovani]|uniref:T-complex protein 11 family protein n=1 Tax=Leishmania donovani TaxID=5661 RepID=A0A504XAM5_LEIDO|nr:T-complex protein 11 family protein [Leishmania donovani]
MLTGADAAGDGGDVAAPKGAPAPKQRVRISDSMRELSADLQQLEDLGLSLDPLTPPSSDSVEHILITDSWSCTVCGTTGAAICPLTGKPHRRRLVSIAQHALRLIELHVGKVYVRSAPLSKRVDGEVQVRTQRRLTMNPHTFLLAFYFASQASTAPKAASDGAQTPPLSRKSGTPGSRGSAEWTGECARHLLDVVREIKVYGASPTDDAYCHSLLKSMRSAWLQYSRQVKRELAADSASELESPKSRPSDENTQASLPKTAKARDELVSCTRSTLIEAVAHSRKDPDNQDLKRFTALLYQRLSRLCTADEFADVKRRVEKIEAYDSTPRIEYATPPCVMLDANTTASEDEAGGATAALAGSSTPGGAAASGCMRRRAGPELPPGWYVDERGVSRPPADHEERKRRERYLQKEFKAQKAYEAVMQMDTDKDKPEQPQARVAAALTQAELQLLATDLNTTPPHLKRLFGLLTLVEDRFVEALPPRLRPRLRQEFHDVLDWNVIQRQARGNARNISNLVRFVGEKVIECSSPAREATMVARMSAVCDDIERCTPDVGTAVANAFAFLFEAIRELREDVAKFSLVMINASLKQNAVHYIQEFISACLPLPRKWTRSIAFLQRFINDERVLLWSSVSVPQAWTSVTAEERRVRGALLIGTLDLLRSGRHTSLDRWVDLPPEIFYFEKHIIFKAANTVQECTLLLLLDGAISSVLARRAMKPATVSAVIRHLHSQIMLLLAEDIRLDTLKDSVIDFVESQLYHLHVGEAAPDDEASLAAVGPKVTLTDTEKQTVRSTIDKMTNTEDPLYVTFERRVLQFMEAMLVRNTDDVAPLGLVTNTLKQQVQLLRHMLVFHWEVYMPSYREMLPSLSLESTATVT